MEERAEGSNHCDRGAVSVVQHTDKAMACPLLWLRKDTRSLAWTYAKWSENGHSILWHCSLCPCGCASNTVFLEIAKISVLLTMLPMTDILWQLYKTNHSSFCSRTTHLYSQFWCKQVDYYWWWHFLIIVFQNLNLRFLITLKQPYTVY